LRGLTLKSDKNYNVPVIYLWEFELISRLIIESLGEMSFLTQNLGFNFQNLASLNQCIYLIPIDSVCVVRGKFGDEIIVSYIHLDESI